MNGTALGLVALVAALRLLELAYATRNTRRLLARGGIEAGRRHYPLIVLLHASWLAAIALATPAGAAIEPVPLAIFLALQPARLWVIARLGEFWTTRVITIPGAPLVAAGPYRWLRHPNYLIVALEIASLPLAFGAVTIAVVFSGLNALLLAHRIRVEERALRDRRCAAAASRP